MKSSFLFIPGLGADRRFFLHQQRAFKNSIFPPWLEPKKNEPLTQYARRWATQLKPGRGCCLVGVSFGGMVVQEMAPWVQLKAIV